MALQPGSCNFLVADCSYLSSGGLWLAQPWKLIAKGLSQAQRLGDATVRSQDLRSHNKIMPLKSWSCASKTNLMQDLKNPTRLLKAQHQQKVHWLSLWSISPQLKLVIEFTFNVQSQVPCPSTKNITKRSLSPANPRAPCDPNRPGEQPLIAASLVDLQFLFNLQSHLWGSAQMVKWAPSKKWRLFSKSSKSQG